jgi:hypothetical protein
VGKWNSLPGNFGQGMDLQALSPSSHANVIRPFGPISAPVPVSLSFPDFFFSRMAGFTQSETSTAWCGSNVVVGFNDSGSINETLLFGPGGISGSGASISNDGGFSFRDIGFVNPGPNIFNFLEGDPVVNCANPSTFYYSQLFFDGSSFLSAVAVSKSTDGGATWADPVTAVAKDFSHIIDKDWSTVDLKHPNWIYVTYTDFDFSFTTCPTLPRSAIELVRSNNGGATWSAPTVVDQVCSDFPDFPFLQGSQVVVDSHGTVYVEWERFAGFAGATRELRIARSTNKAASFQPSSKIDNVIQVGDGYALQGHFRDPLTGSLAVDRSGTKTDGDLYVTWDDGRFFATPDIESPTGFYNYANVLVSRSSDGGKTWSAAVRVNNDPTALPNGSGIDHFQPAVSVDNLGNVGVCWYDRRNDPMNYKVGRFCSVKKVGSSTWPNYNLGLTTWQPIHDVDAYINPDYLGDYDSLASDSTNASPGFQGAYGNVTTAGVPVPNQDVFLVHTP